MIGPFLAAECRRALFLLHPPATSSPWAEFPAEAVAASGPILSIAQPCFGQTCMKCGAERRRPSVNPRAALHAVDIWSANGHDVESETNQSARCSDRARGRTARARL